MIPKDYFTDFKFRDNIILEGYRGSIAHGVYIKEGYDDKDIFGLFIPPKEYVIGLQQYDHYEKIKQEWDVLYYSLRKFVSLALKGNPNVLCLLWLNQNYYTKITPIGQILINNRDIFTSKSCHASFVGYAYGQLRKMTKYGEMAHMGAKRKELVAKFGYDPKHGSHCLRLLKMGIEYLTTGELKVFRDVDKQMLLAVKLGEWSLEKIQEEADRLFKLADEAFVRSTLPNKPDFEKAERLLIDLHEEFWSEKQCRV
jgi:hypothetical protein